MILSYFWQLEMVFPLDVRKCGIMNMTPYCPPSLTQTIPYHSSAYTFLHFSSSSHIPLESLYLTKAYLGQKGILFS